MCSGVVPQQPPTRLSQPFSAHFLSFGAKLCGVSGKPVSDNGSGRPAFGYALMKYGEIRASSSTYGSISSGPNEQFKPTMSGSACAIEMRKASTVCPLSVRPERSVTVPEIISGSFSPSRSKTSEIADSAAFALSVSKTVSTSKRSTPPSTSAFAWSK